MEGGEIQIMEELQMILDELREDTRTLMMRVDGLKNNPVALMAGRNLALAFTHLEDARMRLGKALEDTGREYPAKAAPAAQPEAAPVEAAPVAPAQPEQPAAPVEPVASVEQAAPAQPEVPAAPVQSEQPVQPTEVPAPGVPEPQPQA